MKNEINVKIDIEPIVKLECINSACTHNFINFRSVQELGCNLKHLSLDENGKCVEFAPMRKKEGN